ncbi:MAG: tRNA uridine-5-carboxymethylaminomethyl(34) synthesis GTPase MnmE [Firmicutes bacterium]|nr:tRNA uridine-5-carboxymethylaminomethyl(34) synthesis GTPase MnmE [Bacillota bacterium]
MLDTIAAISTSLGVGAISIIRVSGNEAINIVNKIFKGKNLNEVETHTIHYGFIVENSKKIDEVLVSVMKSPKTFTMEDVVEINCHGGIATTKKVLELLLINGCRLAEPGEFTKRAFLNGRIDLIEAEGIMDLIDSKTEVARNLAMEEVSGNTSNLIHQLREKIVEIISQIEVNIDYPEYDDVKELKNNEIIPFIKDVKQELSKIIKMSENSKIIKEGINTVIIGKPNVGKSSILNALIEEEKAIVTDIPGTTRDVVEGVLNLDGIILNIIDTAGIRETNDIVEKIGVSKSLSLIDKSDLIIFVLNNNEPISEEEKEILEKIKNKPHIVIVNKIDLESKINLDNQDYIRISVKNNIGLDKLKSRIKELFNIEKLNTSDMNYLVNSRSLAILKNCNQILDGILDNIDNDFPIDMLEIDIKEVWNLLGSIIGETYEEELLDNLFSRFCLGK